MLLYFMFLTRIYGRIGSHIIVSTNLMKMLPFSGTAKKKVNLTLLSPSMAPKINSGKPSGFHIPFLDFSHNTWTRLFNIWFQRNHNLLANQLFKTYRRFFEMWVLKLIIISWFTDLEGIIIKNCLLCKDYFLLNYWQEQRKLESKILQPTFECALGTNSGRENNWARREKVK